MLCGGAALANPVTLTELPAGTSLGNPQYLHINGAGMLAGDRQSNRTFCWTSNWGLAAIDPTAGPGLPTISGTWTQGVNDLGQVLATGCIPPPGGNGTCGTYLYRVEAGANGPWATRLDFTTLGGAFTQPGYLSDIQFSPRGSVAAVFNVNATYAVHPIVWTDAGGWHDLTSLVPAGYAVRSIAMNAQDHVLFEVGNQMYMWTEAGGLTYISGQPTMAVGIGMNDFDEIAGWTAIATGNAAFRLSPSRGYQIVAGNAPFDSAFAYQINNSGMVIGTYSGGTFIFSDGAGTQDLGLPGNLVGINSRGDVIAEGHDMTTYEPIPMIKLFGKPTALVQDYIDAGQEKLVVKGISKINDHGVFAVTGNRPGTPQFQTNQIAFLVTPVRCVGDFDGSGATEVADIFGFLNAWFAGDVRADADENGSLSTGDIFTFLNAWMTGC
jgi:hypothetical protein